MQSSHAAQIPTVLGSVATPDGGELRYLGYADGIYAQVLSPKGEIVAAIPYTTWSEWTASPAAAHIQVVQRYNLDEAAQ
jgi:hypothetical protein